jgi:flagellar capping protein FliD
VAQTQPDHLDRIEAFLERLTRAIASIDKKLDVFQTQTHDQLKAVNQQFHTVEQRFDAVEPRLSVILLIDKKLEVF